MKKILFILVCLILTSACEKAEQNPRPATGTEFLRSAEFHDRNSLAGVVVFSRHNLRAPKSGPGSFISTVTPHTWYDFGVGNFVSI